MLIIFNRKSESENFNFGKAINYKPRFVGKNRQCLLLLPL